MAEAPAIYLPSSQRGALRQGEIISNLAQAHLALDSIGAASGELVLRKIHPFAVIVTQDCDLDWDFRARHGGAPDSKCLPNILFCEVMSAVDLRRIPGMNSELWRRASQNKDERYHFLQQASLGEDARGQGLPELGIDFKRYFTVPTDEVYLRVERGEAQRRCRLASPYLEHLSTRFFYFQMRVALPADHYSLPGS